MCIFLAPVAAGAAAAAGSAAAAGATAATVGGMTAAAAAGSGAALSAAGAAAAAGATAGTAMAGGAAAAATGFTAFMANNAFLISSAVSAMGTAATIAGQASQQSAQKKYAAAQADAIRANTIAGYDQLGLQKQQELANASQKIGATSLDAVKARARARVAAGEAGVSGISVDALMADFSRQEGVFNSTVEENYTRRAAQIDLNMQGLQKGAQGQINQIPEPKAPDFAGAALRLGGDALKAYSVFRDDRNNLKIPSA